MTDQESKEVETKILLDDIYSRRDRMTALAKNADPPLSPNGTKILHGLKNNYHCLESPLKFLEQLASALKELKASKLTPNAMVIIGIDSIALASYVFLRYQDLEIAISGIRKIFEILLQPSPE